MVKLLEQNTEILLYYCLIDGISLVRPHITTE